MIKNEFWKDISEYEEHYQASNIGRIRSLQFKGHKRVKILKQHLNQNGYYAISLYKDKKGKIGTVHRLIAKAFLGVSNLTVNHKNGIKTDNRVENLEYLTLAENNRHAQSIGLHDRKNKKLSQKMKNELSEESPRAILTEKQVIEIRDIYSKGGISQKKLGQIYGLTQSAIHLITSYKNWNKLG